ncbi:hypothetical protein ACTXT7_001887 [Hymenolepis weldensis]
MDKVIEAVVQRCSKCQQATHGLPEFIVTDNDIQFSSALFITFARLPTPNPALNDHSPAKNLTGRKPRTIP